jgi:hypothetical protein
MIVACVRVAGNVPYAPEYVYKLRNMVQRHMALYEQWRFVCLTDVPDTLHGIETIAIPPPRFFGWWSKLELFNPKHFPAGETVLSLDLDVIVLKSLAEILIFEPLSTLTLAADEGTFQGSGTRKVIKRYNSSCMRFVAGAHSDLYTEWNASITQQLWGDQDWIGQRKPNQVIFPRAWFPRISNIGADKQRAAGAHVVLCKHPKNHLAARMWPWVAEAWR